MITGYDNSTGIVSGSELKLVCSSNYTYPTAMLSWYRDDKLISKNYDTIESIKTTESIFRLAKVSPSDEVQVGKQISAVCFTEPSNPAPKLRFTFDGVEYEPSSFGSIPTAASIAIGAFVVNGTFSQTVKHEHNNKELKCYAENKAANIIQIVTKQIKVLCKC